eukprot:5899672-Amphidinium_carterae.1
MYNSHSRAKRAKNTQTKEKCPNNGQLQKCIRKQKDGVPEYMGGLLVYYKSSNCPLCPKCLAKSNSHIAYVSQCNAFAPVLDRFG